MEDFEDFILNGGWEFLFPDDSETKNWASEKELECSSCEAVIALEEIVQDEKGNIVCPECGEK